VSGSTAAGDNPRGLTDWAAYGTRIVDEREQDTTGARGTRLRLAKLELLEWSEWVQTKVYDERPPTCLQYSIVWKVNLNKKLDCKDTEQDLMLALQLHCES
jgi:hypothetical protein